jgi:hypothetical protein
MANVIEGTYTLKELLQITRSKFRTRFKYEKRDVLRRVTIQKITELNPDRPLEPTIKFLIDTRSYPQYPPYIKGKRGIKQRKVFHDYDTILEMDEMSLDSKNWKCRVGTGKKIKKAPPTRVKSISRETRKKWETARDRELSKTKDKDKIAQIKKAYSDKVKAHVKSAKFMNDGDWVAQTLGVNLDFAYRDAFAFKIHGHLFGKWEFPLTRPSKLNMTATPFLPKHLIRILEFLMAKGVMK